MTAVCLVSVLFVGPSVHGESVSLRLHQLADGSFVFLGPDDEIVAYVTDSAETESAANSPPQLPGWPFQAGEVSSTPTVGDINGDGGLDVAFATLSGVLFYVVDANANLLPNWPFPAARTGHTPSLVDVDGDGAVEFFLGAGENWYGLNAAAESVPGWPRSGLGFATTGIDDLDGDGDWEFAVSDGGHFYVRDEQGELLPGWPFVFSDPLARSTKGPALGDVDGDGIMEIAVPQILSILPALLLFGLDGEVRWDLTFSPSALKQGVSMVDLDRDGKYEILVQEFSGVWVLDQNGQPLPGWPVPPRGGNIAPAIGDIDDDGAVEFVWATIGGNGRVHVLNDDGAEAAGWPVTVSNFSFNPQVTLGDVDGDGQTDIVVGGFTATFSAVGRIYAWHADGTLVSGFPIGIPDGTAVTSSSVTITDLDQDGDVDLLVGTAGFRIGNVFAFDLEAPYHPTTLEWPTLGHDIRHTSRYEPPPRLAAHAGFDREVSCTTLGGEVITLDGSHSADKDSTLGTNEDIVSFEWLNHFGSPSETFLGSGETLDVALGLGSHEITLRVTDSTGNQDTDSVRIAIVDTEAPEILVSHSVLWPPNHRMVDVTAEVQDCSASSFTLVSVESNEPDDAPGLGDGKTTGDIQGVMPGTADLAFELRAERDGTGQGRTYSLVYETEDALGNAATRTVEVFVPHDLVGLTEPLLLAALRTPLGTLVTWSQVTGASSYDVVRGELGGIKDLNGAYHLGSLTCIAAGTSQTSTAGLEDADQPALGEGFYYLAAYEDGSWSGYGTESAAKERFVPPGLDGCH